MTPAQFWIVGVTVEVFAMCLMTSAFHIWDLKMRHASEVRSLLNRNGLLIAALERVLHQHDLMSGHPADESCYSNNCPVSVDHVRMILERDKE